MKRAYFPWIGFAFTSIAGTLLHFAYEWSGESLFFALFSAVNESIWEHMKLIFFPMLLFAAIERRFTGSGEPGFWCHRLAGISLSLILIPTLYYTYTGILGVSADWFNITIFFIAAAAGYLLISRLSEENAPRPLTPRLCLGILCLMGLTFMLLTFFPPPIPFFADPRTGIYGIA